MINKLAGFRLAQKFIQELKFLEALQVKLGKGIGTLLCSA
jgi:hypothetical protein